MTPLVYDLVERTTPQTTVVEVVLGALAVVGTIVVAAIVLGLGLAGLLVVVRRARGDGLDGAGSHGSSLGLGAGLSPLAPSAEQSGHREVSPHAAGDTSPTGR